MDLPEKDKELKKIKVGILLDSFELAAWSHKMIDNIHKSDYAEISLIIKNDANFDNKDDIKKSKNDKFFYKLYRKLDRKIFPVTPNAFQRKDLKPIISQVPVIKVIPKQTKFCDYILDDDITEIEKFDIDVLVRLGFRILKGRILDVAKYGIWSYHHGDNAVNRGGPPGFWEVMNNEGETGVVLQILTDELDGGLNLFKSFSLTDHISVNRNTNNYYWKALSFLPDKLKELNRIGEEEFFEKVKKKNRGLQFYDKPLYKDPKNLDLVRLILKKSVFIFGKKWMDLFRYDQWILLFKISKDKGLSKSFYQFKKIIPPNDRIWADPFAIFKNEKYFIFIEELLFNENKGHISVIEMDEKGNFSDPEVVLKKPYHLSYPHIFENNGELYMLPESKENRTIELYRCVNFPYDWEFIRNLKEDIEAVDATIHFKNNHYWMFANVKRNLGASTHDELFLYYTEDLVSGQWKDHKQNPVVSDVRQARPAGKLFEFEGELYRPSQNCSRHYGYGLNINKVEILNEHEYKESCVNALYPDWEKRLKGVHTFNFDHNLTVIDAIYRRPKFW